MGMRNYIGKYWRPYTPLSFEREPFMVTRAMAVEAAERVIRESPLWTARRQELESLIGDEDVEIDGVRDEATVVRALARRLIARVERSGWVHFQYRSGMGEILSFHPYAARILETLLRIARDEQPILQGFVHSIAALLDPRTFVQRPGVSLSEAKRHAIDLVRELKILERNIHVFTQRILDEAATAANVLEEGLEGALPAYRAPCQRTAYGRTQGDSPCTRAGTVRLWSCSGTRLRTTLGRRGKDRLPCSPPSEWPSCPYTRMDARVPRTLT
jgi:Wadjet anti plasmid transformation system JetA-like protein